MLAQVRCVGACVLLLTVVAADPVNNWLFPKHEKLPGIQNHVQLKHKQSDVSTTPTPQLSPLPIPSSHDCELATDCLDSGHGVCWSRGVCCKGSFCNCSLGYTGRNCENSTFWNCPRQCAGNGVCNNGTCECIPGYSGSDCSTVEFCSEKNFCNGNGICVKDDCQCNLGYTGTACENILACPGNCSSRGICVLGVCQCDPGLFGDSCGFANVSYCLNACSGRGICEEDGMCSCDVGYSGSGCQNALDLCDGCVHGLCVFGEDASPGCECKTGWNGTFCDIFDIANAPCRELAFCSGHGECSYATDDSLGTCNCAPGYAGPTCNLIEYSMCPMECSGRGRCNENSRECVCRGAFGGAACNESLCPATTNGVCDNHGICLPSISDGSEESSRSFSCICDEVHQGKDCSEEYSPNAACPKECSGHGECVETTCSCFQNWKGDACDEYVALSATDLDAPSASEFS